MTTTHGQQVHATGTNGTSVVRYDRASKWYVEGLAGRKQVNLAAAVAAATILSKQGGRVHDSIGGLIFRKRAGWAGQRDREVAAAAPVQAGRQTVTR